MKLRLLNIVNQLTKQKLDALLISSIPSIIYLTGFSSFSAIEREAFVLLTRSLTPGVGHGQKLTPGVRNYILTDRRYSEAVKRDIKDFDPDLIGVELIEISSKLNFYQALKKLMQRNNIKKLGIEENNLTILEYKKLKAVLKNIKTKNFNIDRNIKTPDEIQSIKKACMLSDKTFDYILKKIKPGVTEKKLAFEIKLFIEEQGSGISFEPIVAFGKNSSIPHHKASDQRLATKDQILIDMGAKIDNYCSDMTRTIFFGKATNEQKKMYQTVLQTQKKTIEFLNLKLSIINHKSIKGSEVDKVARNYVEHQGFPSIPHSLGHGIGIEVHESPKLSPNSKDILKPGMVFSIEPGIYIEGFGGVRIEDLVVLKEDGVEILTQANKNLIEIT